MWWSISFLALVPAIAAAESATIERGLRELAEPASEGLGLHGYAFAQLATGATSDAADSAGAVGGELRYGIRSASRRAISGPLESRFGPKHCDAFRIGGQARLGWSDAARARAEQWASFCIPLTVMELGHHLEWDVRPSLLAPLQLRAGENRRETFTFHWQPVRLPVAIFYSGDPETTRPKGDANVFEVRLISTWLLPIATGFARHEHVEVTPFGYIADRVAPWGERRDFTAEAFVGGGEFVAEGSTIQVWIARMQNLALGPVFASAGIGIASGAVGPFEMDPAVTYPAREIEITRPRVMLALESGNRRVHGALRFAQDVTVAPDGYLTYDTRLVAELAATFGKTRAGLEGAVAQTEVHVPGGAPQVKEPTGGASLRIGHRLGRHLHAMLQLEGARSFYAANVTKLDFRPRWGVNAFGGVQMTVGK